jgi:hemerythrin superfamily protein
MPTTKAPTATKPAARGKSGRTTKAAKKQGTTTKKAVAKGGAATKKAVAKGGAGAKKAVAKRTPAAKATGRTTTARNGTATSGRRGAQDVLSLLTRDHREVDALFHRFEATGPRAQKERADLVGRIIEALSVHAALEETVFYPAVRAELEEQNDQVLEALEEHHVVKWTLSELEDLGPDDERYAAKVTVLIESVRHHVDEEEHELFPRLRKALGASRLRELGAELAVSKRTAPKRPHPRSPDTPPGNIIAQAVTAPFDAVAGLTSATAERVRDIVT